PPSRLSARWNASSVYCSTIAPLGAITSVVRGSSLVPLLDRLTTNAISSSQKIAFSTTRRVRSMPRHRPRSSHTRNPGCLSFIGEYGEGFRWPDCSGRNRGGRSGRRSRPEPEPEPQGQPERGHREPGDQPDPHARRALPLAE